VRSTFSACKRRLFSLTPLCNATKLHAVIDTISVCVLTSENSFSDHQSCEPHQPIWLPEPQLSSISGQFRYNADSDYSQLFSDAVYWLVPIFE
jgi:hypothetical protein